MHARTGGGIDKVFGDLGDGPLDMRRETGYCYFFR